MLWGADEVLSRHLVNFYRRITKIENVKMQDDTRAGPLLSVMLSCSGPPVASCPQVVTSPRYMCGIACQYYAHPRRPTRGSAGPSRSVKDKRFKHVFRLRDVSRRWPSCRGLHPFHRGMGCKAVLATAHRALLVGCAPSLQSRGMPSACGHERRLVWAAAVVVMISDTVCPTEPPSASNPLGCLGLRHAISRAKE